MRITLLVLAALLLVAPALAAPNETTIAFIDGVNFGYHMGNLALVGQTNATAEQEYNAHVAALNTWMDEAGYAGSKSLTQNKIHKFIL